MRDQLLSIDSRVGNYRIERAVTSDANGSTYHAVHTLLPRRAVIKVVDASQLLREAIILEALHHPGIVRVYESGVIERALGWEGGKGKGAPEASGTRDTIESKRAWFARELADGPTVASVLAPGAIDRVDAARLLRDLVEVIDHAHRRGIIHCGLRPSRIVMCGSKPAPGKAHRGFPLCITDWSDARAHDAAPVPFVPSPEAWHYASPELVSGDAVDDRVDVYALGVIAYQLYTGTLPFAQRARACATSADDETSHIPAELHCPDVPRELTTLIDQMLSYDQWDRPSCAEVHAQLEELVTLFAASAQVATGLHHRIRKPRWTPSYVRSPDEVTPPPVPSPVEKPKRS